ncbi:TPA: tetratricopeptide repeat protein, partial [Escherichia coli]
MNNNQGYFLFPETRLGPFRDEFEKTLDVYDSDEINETNYVNKLRRLARHAPDIIDIHAHLAYAFALFMLQ